MDKLYFLFSTSAREVSNSPSCKLDTYPKITQYAENSAYKQSLILVMQFVYKLDAFKCIVVAYNHKNKSSLFLPLEMKKARFHRVIIFCDLLQLRCIKYLFYITQT